MATTTVTETTTGNLSLDNGKPNGIELISKIHEIPQFTDKYEERQWAKEHMAGKLAGTLFPEATQLSVS